MVDGDTETGIDRERTAWDANTFLGGFLWSTKTPTPARAKGHTERANKYKAMAMDELTHAATIRDFATQDIDEIKRVYDLPVEVEEKWKHAHRKFNECIASIKLMLN